MSNWTGSELRLMPYSKLLYLAFTTLFVESQHYNRTLKLRIKAYRCAIYLHTELKVLENGRNVYINSTSTA